MFAVPAVLAIPAAPALSAVAAVPAVLTIPVVPVLAVVRIAATAPASVPTAAVLNGPEDQHSSRHPPEGIEEAEADQGQKENEKQGRHCGLPRRNVSSLPGTGASLNRVVLSKGCG